MAKSDVIDIQKLQAYISDHLSANQIARKMNSCSQVIWEAVRKRAPELEDALKANGSKRWGGTNTVR